jgi:thioredoxin-like negative regulator of GroEL
MAQDISVDEFYDALRRDEHAVIVEVWAPWCAPCRAMAPALERVSQAYAGHVALWKLNADEQMMRR